MTNLNTNDSEIEQIFSDFMGGKPRFANESFKVQAQAVIDYLRPKLNALIATRELKARIYAYELVQGFNNNSEVDKQELAEHLDILIRNDLAKLKQGNSND